ncbi:type IV toxin-antitoxin system AbiEi family antitoxin domain-containing protein [Histidinibacterium aquaticum]|uniref:type IV toxin-antitoxin system AbiEi family antitoxin domain-containing protein n=1 Tax=Histidinibacterium aquaticum TaxID=2613962 RepID=UPI0037BF7468
MTNTATEIVTALENGPSTARELSHRLHRIGYANLRQALSRLAKSGIVIKLGRGLYALPSSVTPPACSAFVPQPNERLSKPTKKSANEAWVADWRSRVQQAFEDYEALDHLGNPEAFAHPKPDR